MSTPLSLSEKQITMPYKEYRRDLAEERCKGFVEGLNECNRILREKNAGKTYEEQLGDYEDLNVITFLKRVYNEE
jgi:hypothetical protein